MVAGVLFLHLPFYSYWAAMFTHVMHCRFKITALGELERNHMQKHPGHTLPAFGMVHRKFRVFWKGVQTLSFCARTSTWMVRKTLAYILSNIKASLHLSNYFPLSAGLASHTSTDTIAHTSCIVAPALLQSVCPLTVDVLTGSSMKYDFMWNQGWSLVLFSCMK